MAQWSSPPCQAEEGTEGLREPGSKGEAAATVLGTLWTPEPRLEQVRLDLALQSLSCPQDGSQLLCRILGALDTSRVDAA